MDPFALPGMHEHMIRSPPPTTWPKSPNCRVFHFPNGDDETLRVEVNNVCFIFRIYFQFKAIFFRPKKKPKLIQKNTPIGEKLMLHHQNLCQDFTCKIDFHC